MNSNQANKPFENKWQTRIEKRKNERGDVLGYVEQVIRDNEVPVDDVASFLTLDELEETNSAPNQDKSGRRSADGSKSAGT